MNFYYTTSAGVDEVQQKPNLSIGGFKSASKVLNDEFGNLFDEISVYTITKNKNEYIALMLKNETGADKTNLQIWVVAPEVTDDDTPYSKYQLAGVIPTQDGDGNYYIERLETKYSKPFYATFGDYDLDNKLDLGDLTNDSELGIWVKRELLIDDIQEDACDVYEEDPDDSRRYIAKEKGQSDTFQIVLSWD